MDEGNNTENLKSEVLDSSISIKLLPSKFFFYKVVNASKKLSSKQITEFATSSLESISPFALEQLCWGFVKRNSSAGNIDILIYAATKERIAEFYAQSDSDTHVMPEFAIGFLAAQADYSLFTNNTSGALFQSIENSKNIIAIFDEINEKILSPKEFLLKKNIDCVSIPVSQIELIETKAQKSGDIKCLFRKKSINTQPSDYDIVIQAEDVWHADIRDKAFLEIAKKQRKITYRVGALIKVALLFFALLFGFEILFGAAKFAYSIKNKYKVNIQKKAVAIESQDFMVRKIQQTIEQEMRPFELIKIMNDFRPSSIHFSSATIDSGSNVVVDAIAERANDVEAYRQSLNNSDLFEAISIDNITSTHNGTKFNLHCNFKEKTPTKFLSLKNQL